MRFELDKFNGVIIDPASLPISMEELHSDLDELMVFLKYERKFLAWITLPIASSDLIPSFIRAGFTFHSCMRDALTLVREHEKNVFVPFVPSHTIGAGAIVLNEFDEILLVKERGTDYFKLPGGFVEPAERIEDSIRREVYEETGIEAVFESIVGITTKHPYQFGKSNLHFICRMKASAKNIEIRDKDEIEEAKWIPLEDYISQTGNSMTDRQIVSCIARSKGLSAKDFAENIGPHRRNEIFIAD